MRPPLADPLPRATRRFLGVRADHALLALGSGLMVVGSFLPWIRGSTRVNGYLDWTGLDDTGEGVMLIGAVVLLAIWVRWRSSWEELGSRARLTPLVIAIACALLWLIAFRKVLYLSWFELAVGARPQPGLLIAGLGIAVVGLGSLLVAMDRAGLTGGAGPAGGPGNGHSRGADRAPNPGAYSVVARVDRPGERDHGDDGDTSRRD